MMRFLNIFGYHCNLDSKYKFTYIITTLSIFLVALFFVFFIIFADSFFVILSTLICFALFFSVYYFLSHKKYLIARSFLILGFLFQEIALVFFWFPSESHFNYFFFVIAPITFFIFDFDIKIERYFIIGSNILATVLLFLSEMLDLTPAVEVSTVAIKLFNGLSVISTITSITIVYYFYANNLSKTYKKLNLLANTDSLTNISNRRVLFSQGADLYNLCKTCECPFALLLFDVDHFKRINDQYGHPVGDTTLVQLTNVISANIHKYDIFSRYGGEEFAIILKNITNDDHIVIANQIQKTIGKHPFMITEGVTKSLTVSVGVVAYSANYNSFEEMVQHADKALYKAKENGRNQVVICTTKKKPL